MDKPPSDRPSQKATRQRSHAKRASRHFFGVTRGLAWYYNKRPASGGTPGIVHSSYPLTPVASQAGTGGQTKLFTAHCQALSDS
jgi:hypothetical protein